MARTLQHGGFEGSVEWSEDDGVYYGKILGTRDVVSYEGDSVEALEEAFREAVDDYLELRKKIP